MNLISLNKDKIIKSGNQKYLIFNGQHHIIWYFSVNLRVFSELCVIAYFKLLSFSSIPYQPK